MESSYLCTKFVRERAAPRQRASSLHSVCTVLVTRISKGMQIFLLLNYPTELRPRKGFIEQNPNSYWSCAPQRRLHHNEFGAVAGLVGYMGRGLRFLYAHTDSASPYQTLMREL